VSNFFHYPPQTLKPYLIENCHLINQKYKIEAEILLAQWKKMTKIVPKFKTTSTHFE